MTEGGMFNCNLVTSWFPWGIVPLWEFSLGFYCWQIEPLLWHWLYQMCKWEFMLLDPPTVSCGRLFTCSPCQHCYDFWQRQSGINWQSFFQLDFSVPFPWWMHSGRHWKEIIKIFTLLCISINKSVYQILLSYCSNILPSSSLAGQVSYHCLII